MPRMTTKTKTKKGVRIEVYKSDGSDGYSPGAWGVTVRVVVRGVECASGDGGFPSRAMAVRRGKEIVKATEAW